MDVFEKRRANDLDGLSWIYRAGWLRTAELGKLMFPNKLGQRQQADRCARGWLERRLLLARPLPDGAGRALVLSAAGVQMLRDAGLPASSSGKDIGQMRDSGWMPPRDWRHHLIALGTLCNLAEQGWEVYPEVQIKRACGGKLAKLPDGLAVRENTVLWLEAEHARKQGHHQAWLVEAVRAVAARQVAPLFGHTPTLVLVAYVDGQRDERGHQLDHRSRVRSAIARAARTDVPVRWACCTLKGVGVASVSYQDDQVKSDLASAVLQVLDAGGWRGDEEEGLVVGNYGKYEVTIFEDDYSWGWVINDGEAFRTENVSSGKREAAAFLATLAEK